MTPVMAMKGKFPNSPIPLPPQAHTPTVPTQNYQGSTQVLTHKPAKKMPVAANASRVPATATAKKAIKKTGAVAKAVK